MNKERTRKVFGMMPLPHADTNLYRSLSLDMKWVRNVGILVFEGKNNYYPVELLSSGPLTC